MLRRSFPYVEAFTVVLIWAISPPLIKIILEDISPFDIASLRYVTAFLLFLPLLFFLFSRESASSKYPRLAPPEYYGIRWFCHREHSDVQGIGEIGRDNICVLA